MYWKQPEPTQWNLGNNDGRVDNVATALRGGGASYNEGEGFVVTMGEGFVVTQWEKDLWSHNG